MVEIRAPASYSCSNSSSSESTTIVVLQDELAYQAGRKGVIPQDGFEITIMGDREIPYWLLKKIMLTCQLTDFARISLAVNKVEVGAPESNEGANEDLAGSGGDAPSGGAS